MVISLWLCKEESLLYSNKLFIKKMNESGVSKKRCAPPPPIHTHKIIAKLDSFSFFLQLVVREWILTHD